MIALTAQTAPAVGAFIGSAIAAGLLVVANRIQSRRADRHHYVSAPEVTLGTFLLLAIGAGIGWAVGLAVLATSA